MNAYRSAVSEEVNSNKILLRFSIGKTLSVEIEMAFAGEPDKSREIMKKGGLGINDIGKTILSLLDEVLGDLLGADLDDLGIELKDLKKLIDKAKKSVKAINFEEKVKALGTRARRKK